MNTPCLSEPLNRPRWRPRWVKIVPRSSPLGKNCSPLLTDILVISPLLESWSGDDPRYPLTFLRHPRWRPRLVKTAPRSSPLGRNWSPLPAEISPEYPLDYFLHRVTETGVILLLGRTRILLLMIHAFCKEPIFKKLIIGSAKC